MLAAPGQGEAENGSAAGRDGRGPPVRNPAGSMSPRWEGTALPRLPGAEGGDTLAPVAPVEQSAGAKGQD